MKLAFDSRAVSTTEFGVGRDDGESRTFVYVPADATVGSALLDMVRATRDAMTNLTQQPAEYDPSEKYSALEHVLLPIDNDMAAALRNLHRANNLDTDANALTDPASLFCYFVRLTDAKGQRLTGLRRATQFKGIVKKRVVRFVTDAVRLVEEHVFPLDADFDLLIDTSNLHILRPSGFEFVAQLQAAVMRAASENIKAIQRDLGFVDFKVVKDYASKHPRAARYLASIRSQEETKNVDKRALKRACKQTGVEIRDVNGRIHVAEGHVMGFLEVLDRRRYEIELVQGLQERYRAASRQRLSDSGGSEQ